MKKQRQWRRNHRKVTNRTRKWTIGTDPYRVSEETSHVVIVSQHYPPDQSGNASRISDTSTNLCQEGWEVTVLAPPPAFPHGEFSRTWRKQTTSERDGVTIHRLWA